MMSEACAEVDERRQCGDESLTPLKKKDVGRRIGIVRATFATKSLDREKEWGPRGKPTLSSVHCPVLTPLSPILNRDELGCRSATLAALVRLG